jgi:hypothetical protein
MEMMEYCTGDCISRFKGEIGNYLFSERPISRKNVGQIGIN